MKFAPASRARVQGVGRVSRDRRERAPGRVEVGDQRGCAHAGRPGGVPQAPAAPRGVDLHGGRGRDGSRGNIVEDDVWARAYLAAFR